jgi:hypothetical protein
MSILIYFITCGKRRQPRKNVTKERTAEPSTPQRPTREESYVIVQEESLEVKEY